MAGKFKITIKEEWCKGCRFCVDFCPNDVYEMGKDAIAEVVNEENCIGCYYSCEVRCPDFAIIIEPVEEADENVKKNEKNEMEGAIG